MKESIEMYLVSIYRLSLVSPAIRSIDVAHNLNVARPDVFRAVKALKLFGLVDQKHYGSISLTAKGREKARSVIAVKQTIIDFLSNTLRLTVQDATENATRIEHCLTESALIAIKEYASK